MIITALFILTVCIVMAWGYYDLRRTHVRLEEMRKKWDNQFDKELDNFGVSGYNKERDEFIERMTRLKLVYNADTDAWDKLKELEE